MSIKLKTPNKEDPANKLMQNVVRYKGINVGIPGIVGKPLGGFPTIGYAAPIVQKIPMAPIKLANDNLQHAVNYYADYGGCGFWRMYWPELYLNAYQKAVINGLSKMILEPRFYSDIKAVKLQRQATPTQLEFMKFLKMASKEYGFKLIYEIDDIVFKDDIPDYNKCKDAFTDPAILKSILAMMQIVDEISVTCPYMRDYYIEKTGNKNISVVPNYPPRGWIDRFYNRVDIAENFEKNQSRPRVGYCGSGTHFDQSNRTGYKDDFNHVIRNVIDTRHKYKWVFLGSHPMQVLQYIKSGEMEFHH